MSSYCLGTGSPFISRSLHFLGGDCLCPRNQLLLAVTRFIFTKRCLTNTTSTWDLNRKRGAPDLALVDKSDEELLVEVENNVNQRIQEYEQNLSVFT